MSNKELSEKILDTIEAKLNRTLRISRAQVESGKAFVNEDDWNWFSQYTVGHGVNICSGIFPIHDSIGVDIEFTLSSFDGFPLCRGDELPIDNSCLDYVITNYMEAFSNPSAALREWYRILKPGGKLAIIARDADERRYAVPKGVLSNNHRASCFNVNTLKMYIERASFKDVVVNRYNETLRAIGIK